MLIEDALDYLNMYELLEPIQKTPFFTDLGLLYKIWSEYFLHWKFYTMKFLYKEILYNKIFTQ